MSRYKEEKINKDLQSMGYRDIQDFYKKNPSSNFDVTPLSTKVIRKVGRYVKNTAKKIKDKIIKRYE
jgi:hypothetical protein